MQKNQEHRSHREAVSPPYVLDLHGMRKSEAMAALTDFLECHQQSANKRLHIITGTGSHSRDRPVLRNAVEEYLKKRMVIYERDTPGSFSVKAGSGILYFRQESTESDTKVLVQPRSGEDEEDSTFRVVKGRSKAQSQEFPTNEPGPNGLFQSEPSLSEVAKYEADWEKALAESLDEHRSKQNEDNRKEKTEIQMALELSRAEQMREEQELSQSINVALQASKAAAQEEWLLMEQAILLSKVEHQTRILDEDREYQQAISESIRFQEESSHREGEEEKLLRQVLARSLQE